MGLLAGSMKSGSNAFLPQDGSIYLYIAELLYWLHLLGGIINTHKKKVHYDEYQTLTAVYDTFKYFLYIN